MGQGGVSCYPGSSNVYSGWHLQVLQVTMALVSAAPSLACHLDFASTTLWTGFPDLSMFLKVGLPAQLFFSISQFSSRHACAVVPLGAKEGRVGTLLGSTQRYALSNKCFVHNAITQHKLQLHVSWLHCWEQGECIPVFSHDLYSTATTPQVSPVTGTCHLPEKLNCRTPCHKIFWIIKLYIGPKTLLFFSPVTDY